MKKLRGFSYVDALLLLVVFIWGGHFGVVKSALEHVHPLAFAALRFAAAAAVLFGILLLTEGSVGLDSRRDFKWGAVLGALSGTYQVLWMLGLRLTTTAKSSLLLATSPLFVTLIAFLRGERLSRRSLIGTVTAFVGVAVIVWPYEAGIVRGFFGGQLAGDLMTLVGAVLWGAYVAYGDKLLDRYSPLRVTAWAFFWTAVIVALPGIPVLLKTSLAALPLNAWLSLGYSIFLAGVLCFVLWYNGVSQIGSIRVALYQYMVTVVAMLLAFFLWREPFNSYQAVGAAIVLTSIIVVRLEQSSSEVDEPGPEVREAAEEPARD